MRFLKMIAAANRQTEHLIRSLYQVVGNKGYMREIEEILGNLELSAPQVQALDMLARDLKNVKSNAENNSAQNKRWGF